MPADVIRTVRSVAVVTLLAVVGCTHASPRANTPPLSRIEGVVTTPDRVRLLAPLDGIAQTSTSDTTGTRIDVDTSQRFQEIAGFGAALTDASASLLQSAMTPVQRESLLQELFGHGPTDARFGAVRITLGASDFSATHYTFDDVAAGTRDDSLTQFSIAPHRAAMLPIMRRAREINPQLTIMATPWSAPAWMKTSGSLNGGTLRADAFDVYARYLTRALDTWREAKVPIDLLSVQNEPHHEPGDYPGMRFDAAQRARFVGQHLGPLFAARRVTTRILDWDHNWDEAASPLAVLRDTTARRYISGVAWHCYAGDVSAQTTVHDAFPGVETWFTECAGGAWAPNFGDNLRWNTQTLIIGATRNWARGVMLWNLALNASHGPHLGGCSNCRGVLTIDTVTGAVTRNEEYYALAHASRYVHRGAVRIGSTAERNGIATVAFQNADDRSIVMIAVNGNTSATAIHVAAGRTQFTSTIPAGAVVTYRWP